MAFAFDLNDTKPDSADRACGVSECQLYEFWQSIHPGNGLLPGRQHFDPVAFAERHPQLLPHLWLVDVERTPLRFRLRLIGGKVSLTSPFAGAGQYVDEFIDMAARVETLHSAFARLVETGQPEFRRGGPNPAANSNIRAVSRLSLPLAADGRNVDMILNLTTYVWSTPRKPRFRLSEAVAR